MTLLSIPTTSPASLGLPQPWAPRRRATAHQREPIRPGRLAKRRAKIQLQRDMHQRQKGKESLRRASMRAPHHSRVKRETGSRSSLGYSLYDYEARNRLDTFIHTATEDGHGYDILIVHTFFQAEEKNPQSCNAMTATRASSILTASSMLLVRVADRCCRFCSSRARVPTSK